MKFKKRDKYSGNVWLTTRIDWHSKFIVKLSLISWLPDQTRISPNLSVWKRERSIYANIAPIVIFNPPQVFVPNEAELYNPKHDRPDRQGRIPQPSDSSPNSLSRFIFPKWLHDIYVLHSLSTMLCVVCCEVLTRLIDIYSLITFGLCIITSGSRQVKWCLHHNSLWPAYINLFNLIVMFIILNNYKTINWLIDHRQTINNVSHFYILRNIPVKSSRASTHFKV